MQFGLILLMLVLVNVLSANIYERFDLTKEKRFTLSGTTRILMSELEDVVYVKVYLEGEFPAGFKRLRDATMDMLDEFRSYSGSRLEYTFIDPSLGNDPRQKALIQEELYDKGMSPINLKIAGNDQMSQKLIFPWALMTYGDKEMAVQLLETQVGVGPQEALNTSVALLEYKLANTIMNITRTRKKQLVFTEGHAELPVKNLAGIHTALAKFYDVSWLDLTKSVVIPPEIAAVIVAKPRLDFSEQDKFKLDQYIMNGGKVLWFLDGVSATMDSLQENDAFMAMGQTLNLDDLLFKYGVRVNTDLIQDMQCNVIPVVTGEMGGVPQTQMYPWLYYPVITASQAHPVAKNLDLIMTEFVSSIDTVASKGIQKTVLLTSSDYSRTILAPARVHLSAARFEPDRSNFNKSRLPIAVLLEGSFQSVFKNRLAPRTLQMIDSLEDVTFRTSGEPTKMIVVSDGDLIANKVGTEGNQYPLGYYRFTNQTFANKDFVLNAVEYLCEDNSLIETRSKDLRMRLLDKTKIKSEKLKWQLINTLTPITLILIFGLIYNHIRKRIYTN